MRSWANLFEVRREQPCDPPCLLDGNAQESTNNTNGLSRVLLTWTAWHQGAPGKQGNTAVRLIIRHTRGEEEFTAQESRCACGSYRSSDTPTTSTNARKLRNLISFS